MACCVRLCVCPILLTPRRNAARENIIYFGDYHRIVSDAGLCVTRSIIQLDGDGAIGILSDWLGCSKRGVVTN